MIRALRLAAPLAALMLTTAPAPALDLGAMTEAERAAFGAAVRAYLLENPEVLMEAIGVLEQRQAEQQAAGDSEMIAALSADLFEDPGSWVGGNPEGDITVVEFLDYKCGYCRRAHPEVAELLNQDGNVRLIVKELPILGEQSTLGARFALAARTVAGDDAYKDVSDALMAMRGDIDAGALERLAGELGLDYGAIAAGMTAPEVDAILSRNRALAQALQINGTPSFVFGDTMVRGYVPLEAMQQLVDDLREG
jgi:protein-disulfide isomerase